MEHPPVLLGQIVKCVSRFPRKVAKSEYPLILVWAGIPNPSKIDRKFPFLSKYKVVKSSRDVNNYKRKKKKKRKFHGISHRKESSDGEIFARWSLFRHGSEIPAEIVLRFWGIVRGPQYQFLKRIHQSRDDSVVRLRINGHDSSAGFLLLLLLRRHRFWLISSLSSFSSVLWILWASARYNRTHSLSLSLVINNGKCERVDSLPATETVPRRFAGFWIPTRYH